MFLRLQNVSKFYILKKHWYLKKEQIWIFKDVNFELERGENLLLWGQSGSGKSTLARMIAMLENISAGEIVFKDQLLNSLTFKEQRKMRSNLQYVFQDQKTALHPCKSVKNLIFDVYRNFAKTPHLDEVLSLFDFFELNKNLLDLKPYQLSGGQAARIGLLRALILKPELLILDEITASLDFLSEKKILKFLREFQINSNISYIFISHKKALLEQLCDKQLCLNKL